MTHASSVTSRVEPPRRMRPVAREERSVVVRSLRWLVVVATLLLTGAGALGAQIYARSAPSPFPHDKHTKLFPSCAGCHAGVTTGDQSALMPPPASCVECHDGATTKRVTYLAPTPKQDFLRFEHRAHAAKVEVAARECSSCHTGGDGGHPMRVTRATPESCQGCHTHRATSHLAPDNRCATCHVPIARSTTVTVAQLASLPKPPSHESPRYVEQHAVRTEAEVLQCATCHSRESCARCHVNAANVAAIAQLLPDARVASMLRGKTVTYPTPSDHVADAWASAHGASATENTQRCAACHARPSCTLCHSGLLGSEVIRRLPDGRPPTGAPGVQLVLPRRIAGAVEGAPTRAVALRPPMLPHARADVAADTTRTLVRPHPAGFDRNHAASASSARLTCEGCHAQRFCSDCHAGESRRSFHPANFVARHAPESYGRDLECASCHSTEVFCRSCHLAQGIASAGGTAGTYHNGQPLWLLQHGQAARRGLQSCTTCHVQRDCLQCHSQRGWGVSPHGPDFDASRLGARARTMCARCHIADPTRGR